MLFNRLCLCCLNSLQPSAIDNLAQRIRNECDQRSCHEIKLQITFPPLLDGFRVASRAIICRDFAKTIPFPIYTDILNLALAFTLDRKHHIQVTDQASYIVNIHARVDHQHMLSQVLVPNFQPKKAKRKMYEVVEKNQHLDLISRNNMGKCASFCLYGLVYFMPLLKCMVHFSNLYMQYMCMCMCMCMYLYMCMYVYVSSCMCCLLEYAFKLPIIIIDCLCMPV
ncbi:hypothetical protein EON63_09625 [archaeon]|nr:MAG: hypothetical protein EON63_09625 [archaeon]